MDKMADVLGRAGAWCGQTNIYLQSKMRSKTLYAFNYCWGNWGFYGVTY